MKTTPTLYFITLGLLAAAGTGLAETLPTEPADSPLVLAQETAVTPKVSLRVGAFLLSDITTRFQLNAGPYAVGSNINFASMLGGETSLDIMRVDADWAFLDRHRLDLSWFDIDLRGQRELAANITFGGKTYSLGTTVESRFRTNIYKLAYGYTFYRDQRHEFSALLGAHIVRFETSLSARSLGQFERFAATTPLPSFGLAWKARWTDRLHTRFAVQYFGLSLDQGKYSGHFTDVLAAAEYRVLHQAGIGAGYNRFDLKGVFQNGPLKLTANYAYNGLLVYLFAKY